MSLKTVFLEDFTGLKLVCGKLIERVAKIRWRLYFRKIVKFVAFGTTVTGAVTAISTASTTTGIAISAAGATGTYVSTKGLPKGYEKIKHVSPKTSQRSTPLGAVYKPVTTAKKLVIPKMTSTKRS